MRTIYRAPLGIVAAWLLSIACGQAAQTPAAAQGASASREQTASDPVATIDGAPVTRGELETLVASEVAKLEEQAHQVRRQQLDAIIADRLLDAEAKRRGVTRAALEQAEIGDKVTAVTQADVDAFVQANRARLPADPTVVMPQILRYLQEQRAGERRESYIDALRKNASVKVMLKAPHVFRAPIDLAAMPSRGPADAKVTIVEFSDFHCPFCKKVQPTLDQVLAKYPSQVRLVYKHMPLDNLHPRARRAAEASLCAQQQDKFWQYHDLLYAGGPDGSDVTLSSLAERAGLDRTAFQQCLSSAATAAAVQQQVEEGA